MTMTFIMDMLLAESLAENNTSGQVIKLTITMTMTFQVSRAESVCSGSTDNDQAWNSYMWK